MKKTLLSALAFLIIVTSCRKDDVIKPEDKPDAKLIKAMDEYKAELTGAEFGWKGYLMPDGGGVYSFLFKFDENERVRMISDIDPSFEDEEFESSYRLKATQRPSLFFDTYSYIHVLADPDIANGGSYGTGQYSDFEFAFVSVKEDTIVLDGNFNHSKMILIKSKSKAESDNFMRNISAVTGTFAKLKTYFKRTTINGVEYELKLKAATKTISLNYLDGDILKSHSSLFYIDGNNVVLVDPLVNGSTVINQIENISYSSTGFINGSVNGGNIEIREAISPLKIDANAAITFYNNIPSRGYYVADEGFTIDGVADSLRLTSITNFGFLLFWPKYGTSGGVNYDLLGFVISTSTANTLSYGPAFRTPTFSADGSRITFPYFGLLGSVPATYSARVTATRQLFADVDGFYVVPMGTDEYDLVSVKDARAWMSFY